MLFKYTNAKIFKNKNKRKKIYLISYIFITENVFL